MIQEHLPQSGFTSPTDALRSFSHVLLQPWSSVCRDDLRVTLRRNGHRLFYGTARPLPLTFRPTVVQESLKHAFLCLSVYLFVLIPFR